MLIDLDKKFQDLRKEIIQDEKTLSVLTTISGTAVPTVIAASPYQKQEQIGNINNNIIQKRSNNENINKTKIVIRTKGHVQTSGVAFNNKLYFGSTDK